MIEYRISFNKAITEQCSHHFAHFEGPFQHGTPRSIGKYDLVEFTNQQYSKNQPA